MAADDEVPADVPRPDATVRRLAEAWEARARSERRDFFVASHPGWDDGLAWQRQAQIDCQLFTHGLADPWLANADVLEIGCGVGRLVPALLPRVRSYTGVDIAPSMVAEAQRRCAVLGAGDRARFLVSDGVALPDALHGVRFQLVLAVAVFIHCPLPVVRALVVAAERALAPGGILRCQLRADPADGTGYSEGAPPPAAVDAAGVSPEAQAQQVEGRAAPSELLDEAYMGHAFRVDEARALFAECCPHPTQLLRFDAHHLYVSVQRSVSPAG